jgi:hypothetical protein
MCLNGSVCISSTCSRRGRIGWKFGVLTSVCLSTILPASNLGRFLGAAKINKYGGLIGWYWFDEEVLCEYLKCYDCVSRVHPFLSYRNSQPRDS